MNTHKGAIGRVLKLFALMALFLAIAPCANAATTYYWQAFINGYQSATFNASDPQTACTQAVNSQYAGMTAGTSFSGSGATTGFCTMKRTSDGFNFGNVGQVSRYGDSCPSGQTYDTNKRMCVANADTTCAGYPTPVAAAAAFQWLQSPITCTAKDANGMSTCSGLSPTGKQSSQDILCTGTSGTGPKPTVSPTPVPPVDVAFPRCPAGSYLYTDIDGSSECTKPEPTIPNVAPSCTSGNVGTVNGKYACLPSNPAPSVAKTAANNAETKANTAAANPNTDAAKAAAAGAQADAQRAKDAKDSVSNVPGLISSVTGEYNRAVDAAKRAAGYAGTGGYGAPGSDGDGSGTGGGGGGTGEDTGPKECGTPGKPKCQIDETGTPTGIGNGLDAANAKANQMVNDIKSGADGAVSDSGKDTSLKWMPELPQGTCTEVSFTLPNGSVTVQSDICQWLPKVTVGFELLWAAFFGFSIMGMVAAATSKNS